MVEQVKPRKSFLKDGAPDLLAHFPGYPKIGSPQNVSAWIRGLERDRADLLAALRELLRVDDEWHGSVNSEMSHARSVARVLLAKHAATGGEGKS